MEQRSNGGEIAFGEEAKAVERGHLERLFQLPLAFRFREADP